MHPYTAQENDWLSGDSDKTAQPAPTVTPLEKPSVEIDDATVRMHMRRGEQMRAQEVKRCFVALFRLPGNALRALGAYLKPAAARPHH